METTMIKAITRQGLTLKTIKIAQQTPVYIFSKFIFDWRNFEILVIFIGCHYQ